MLSHWDRRPPFMGAGLTEGLREVSFLVLGVGLGRASWLMRLGNWNPELLEDWRPAGWHHVWLCACYALPVRLCLRAQGTQLSWGEGREKLCSWCRVSEIDPTYSISQGTGLGYSAHSRG